VKTADKKNTNQITVNYHQSCLPKTIYFVVNFFSVIVVYVKSPVVLRLYFFYIWNF